MRKILFQFRHDNVVKNKECGREGVDMNIPKYPCVRYISISSLKFRDGFCYITEAEPVKINKIRSDKLLKAG